MNRAFLCLFAFLFSVSTFALDLSLISGVDQSIIKASDFYDSVEKGSLIVLGESHAQNGEDNYDQVLQAELISELQKRGLKVSVGMEFVAYTFQESLDAYLNSELPEEDFLKNIHWGRTDFTYYKQQVVSPLELGGWTYGINAPRSLTKKIFRKGFDSLSPEERALIPVDFERGNDHYFKRFVEAMGGHGDPNFLENAFLAQSVWDDVMAFQTKSILEKHNPDVFIIIVGNFHVRYGGGLVDRLNVRGVENIISIVQTPNVKYDDDKRMKLATPHKTYGEVSTFVW